MGDQRQTGHPTVVARKKSLRKQHGSGWNSRVQSIHIPQLGGTFSVTELEPLHLFVWP
jgi:hypothetical protein